MSRPLVDYSDLPQSQPQSVSQVQSAQGLAPRASPAKRPRTTKDGRNRHRGGSGSGNGGRGTGRGGGVRGTASVYHQSGGGPPSLRVSIATNSASTSTHIVPTLDDTSAWDDRALIEMWDCAAEEFRIFHSRRSAAAEGSNAQGEPPREEALETNSQQENESVDDNQEHRGSFRWGSLYNRLAESSASSCSAPAPPSATSLPPSVLPPVTFPPSFPSIPLGSDYNLPSSTNQATSSAPSGSATRAAMESGSATQTESLFTHPTDQPQQHLQNLIMAWYYAGYYTREYQLHAEAAATTINGDAGHGNDPATKQDPKTE